MPANDHLGQQFYPREAVEAWEGDMSMDLTHQAARLYPSTREHGWSDSTPDDDLGRLAENLVEHVSSSPNRSTPLYSGHAYPPETSPARVGSEWHVPLMAAAEDPNHASQWASEAPDKRGTVYVMHGAPAVDVNRTERLTSGRFDVERQEGNQFHLRYKGRLER